MTLRLITDTTPKPNDDGVGARVDGVSYSFRVLIGKTLFVTASFFGDQDRIDKHHEQLQTAFKEADRIEVVK